MVKAAHIIMDSETLHMSRLRSVDCAAENTLHKQINRLQCQSSVASLMERNGCLEPKDIGVVGMPNSDTRGSHDETIQPATVYESTTDGNISNLRTEIVADGSAGFPREHQEGEPYKCQRQNNDRSLQDIFELQELFDDEDDDDSDWEPSQNGIISKKWFCTNCIMPNFEDVLHCDVCGEYKESEIVRHGFFASHFARGVNTHSESEELVTYQGTSTRETALGNCTAVGFDERMLLHSEGEMKSHPHPERPDRLRAIIASLATAGIFPGKCFPIPAREITQDELLKVHSLEHIKSVELTSSMMSSYFTPDTYANEHSAHAARLAAGLCADLASEIMSGHAKNGFALVRPPGHHAGITQAMGFCLHNNAAVAVLAARVAGAKKVLIVDWDVHHGNGTQEIFDGDRSVLYISLHRHEEGRFYPGTGAADEVGIMGAEGYSVNVPWKCGGVGDDDYVFAFQHIVLPIASEFSPDLIVISAGFDAARGDPLGGCDVTPAGFGQMTNMLSGLCHGKLLVILEGGYNLRSISTSVTAVIKVLLGESSGCQMGGIVPSKQGLRTVMEVLKVQVKFWPILESSYNSLLPQWEALSFRAKKKRYRRRKHLFGPIWWKWGRKRLMYHLLYGKFRLKLKRRALV
ncbi:histone deacetylase 15-like isoform X2 [Tasmannia lanceolata]|uniref:histone deacetylase 15-like isoform X2 n=1 Tax=Tasmannia lanceolata TaxID=3420 RepID=UPI004064B6C3